MSLRAEPRIDQDGDIFPAAQMKLADPGARRHPEISRMYAALPPVKRECLCPQSHLCQTDRNAPSAALR